ncbi:hypothetical protein RCL1_007765 [Eukaryota sp. TZLM3-RCL]
MNDLNQTFATLKELGPRECLLRVLNVLLIGVSALMIWNSFIIATNTKSPIVVVLSGSMEPGFSRGDLLLLWKTEHINIGDIVVYELPAKQIPIVHRVIAIHESPKNNEILYLTKGDANQVDDQGLYYEGGIKDAMLRRQHILGVVQAYLPFAGSFTIWMADYPLLKFALLAILAVTSFSNKEEK